jgi:hypothetical protein
MLILRRLIEVTIDATWHVSTTAGVQSSTSLVVTVLRSPVSIKGQRTTTATYLELGANVALILFLQEVIEIVPNCPEHLTMSTSQLHSERDGI